MRAGVNNTYVVALELERDNVLVFWTPERKRASALRLRQASFNDLDT